MHLMSALVLPGFTSHDCDSVCAFKKNLLACAKGRVVDLSLFSHWELIHVVLLRKLMLFIMTREGRVRLGSY